MHWSVMFFVCFLEIFLQIPRTWFSYLTSILNAEKIYCVVSWKKRVSHIEIIVNKDILLQGFLRVHLTWKECFSVSNEPLFKFFFLLFYTLVKTLYIRLLKNQSYLLDNSNSLHLISLYQIQSQSKSSSCCSQCWKDKMNPE